MSQFRNLTALGPDQYKQVQVFTTETGHQVALSTDTPTYTKQFGLLGGPVIQSLVRPWWLKKVAEGQEKGVQFNP